MNDKKLIYEFKENNNIKAFEEIVIKYRKRTIGFAYHFVQNIHIAEEIVQEVFALIYIKKNTISLDKNFKSYLFKIIKNKCIDHLRKNRCEMCSMEFYESKLVINNMIEENFIIKESLKKVLDSMPKLPPRYRKIIYLVVIKQLSHKDVADILGITKIQVKVYLHRARKKLKNLEALNGI